MSRKKGLPLTVLVLGWVSFLTDFSSEMIYPLLPLFLSQTLGAGAIALGLVEGLAETVASLLKLVSGAWSDRIQKRRPFILWGYGLAGTVRPLIALAPTWLFVLAIRTVDRVGKGLRSSPRDALIADVTPPRIRGTAYGFHRAMDHAGAVVGPLAAAALLGWSHLGLRPVFLLAALPALAAFLVLGLKLREKPTPQSSSQETPGQETPGTKTFDFLSDWKKLGFPFRFLLLTILIFTLGNSTDAFILMRLGEAGVPASSIALLWAAHHVIKMIFTYAGGRVSDRLGYRPMIIGAWVFYAFIYLLFSLAHSETSLVAIFLAYGVYYGLAEPSEKALVAAFVPSSLRGTAFGFYHLVIGLGALPASIIFGILWNQFGSAVAFSAGALLAGIAALLLALIRPQPGGAGK